MIFKKAASFFLGAASLALGICISDANVAQAGTLTFSGLNLTPGSTIPQSYGDEANLDVVYRSLSGAGNATQTYSFLNYWPSSYSGLQDVAYSPDNSGAEVAEIFLKPLNGATVTLESFELGSWPNVDRNSLFYIYNADYTALLVGSGPITVLGSTPTFASIGITRSDGIRIQFGPQAYNVGIDNIKFSVNSPTAVPTPALLPGLIGLGVAALLKRKAEKIEAEV